MTAIHRHQPPIISSIELRHLRAFIAVAEELSYRKAATRLHLTQPALTRTIQQLELELGSRLLERGSGNMRLTPSGEYFLAQARQLVSNLRQAVYTVHRMRASEQAELRVGFNDFAIDDQLPQIVQAFRSESPDIPVTLLDETSPRMLQGVIDSRLDIAFLSGLTPPPELDSLVIREERLIAVLPAGHRLENRTELTPDDLAEEPFVMGEPAWRVFLDVVNAYCASAGFHPRVVQTAVHSNGIVNLVRAGLGVSIYVEREWLRHHSGIVLRPFAGPQPQLRSLAVWRRATGSAAVLQFIDIMRSVVGSR